MITVRRRQQDLQPPDETSQTSGLLDVRAAVILLLASICSLGSGLGVVVAVSAVGGLPLGLIAGISASAFAMVLAARALHELIPGP